MVLPDHAGLALPPEDQEGAAERYGAVGAEAAPALFTGAVVRRRRSRESGQGSEIVRGIVGEGHELGLEARVLGLVVQAQEERWDVLMVAVDLAEEALVEDAPADRLRRGGAVDDGGDSGAPRDDLEQEIVGGAAAALFQSQSSSFSFGEDSPPT